MKHKQIDLQFYDKCIALSVYLICFAIILKPYVNLNFNIAFFNFLCSIIPSLIMIIKFGIHIPKKYIIPIVIISAIKIINLIDCFRILNLYDIMTTIIYDMSILINLFFIYGVLINTRKPYYFKYIHKSILVIVTVFCLYNIFININSIKYILSINDAYFYNFSSFFPNRNNFAMFLVLSFICLQYLKGNIDKRLLINLIQILIAINILFTFSRTGIVSLIIFFVFTNIKNNWKSILIILYLILSLIILLMQPNIISFVLNILIRPEIGLSGRTQIWETATQLILERPLIGYGQVAASVILKTIEDTKVFHNFIIKSLVTGGILMLLSLFYLLNNSLNMAVYIMKNHNKVGRIIIGSMIILLLYAITEEMNFFSFSLFDSLWTLLIFIIPICEFNNLKEVEYEKE